VKNMFNKSKHVSVGVSACLLGQRVRYDGATKSHDFVVDVLSHVFELEAICPEVEAGLGLPRPPVQLVLVEQEIKMIGVDNARLDVTEAINKYSQSKIEMLGCLRGYIFKARSPSCGLMSPLLPSGQSPGLFAKALMARWPGLPCVEEDALNSEHGQQVFVERVLAYAAQRR